MDENKLFEIMLLLEQGESLNKLDKNGTLGCSRKAFCNGAKKLGYIFDKSVKNFVRIDSAEINISDTQSTKTLADASESIQVEDTVETIVESSTTANLTLESLDARLKVLEEMMLHNNSSVSTLELDSRTAGNIISRSIKVSKEAIERFDFIAESRYPMHSKQSLLSQALIEFYEKHK